MMNKLKLGIPKGSMEESTIKWFGRAGYNISTSERSHSAKIDDEDIEVMLVRPQEMAYPYIQRGVLDAGVTGEDWIRERNADVIEVADLVYAKQLSKPVRWVLAVKNDSDIQSVKDLEGRIIATELVEVTKAYLAKNGVNATVEFSYGATEAKVPYLADAIVELTETGSSLRANNLRIVDVVMTSTAKLIANKSAWQDDWKRTKLQNIAMLLQGAIVAESKVGLKMNISKDDLPALLKILPSMKNPTVSSLSDEGWYAVDTVTDESIVRDLIPELKRVGATDIIEYPLNKVIP
ncbi:TPA: ATP phosphoribosyltransferase [Candidatus Poribacteria bacterium]|nr:ATP phosphoribosyltransferase [Candidatus Poribacteria bacterium]